MYTLIMGTWLEGRRIHVPKLPMLPKLPWQHKWAGQDSLLKEIVFYKFANK